MPENFSWDYFINAWSCMLSSEHYGEEYPLFYEETYKNGFTKEIYQYSLQEALKTPVKSLEEVIDALLENHRYANDFADTIKDIIGQLTIACSEIATIPIYKLFQRTFRNDEKADFEDEIQNYEVRGLIIDVMVEKSKLAYNFASNYAPWENITPHYWEYTNYKDCKDYEPLRLQYLKNCSKFLCQFKDELSTILYDRILSINLNDSDLKRFKDNYASIITDFIGEIDATSSCAGWPVSVTDFKDDEFQIILDRIMGDV